MLDAQLAAGGLGITFDELKQKGFVKVPFKYRKYERDGFKTPTGKIELYCHPFRATRLCAPADLSGAA